MTTHQVNIWLGNGRIFLGSFEFLASPGQTFADVIAYARQDGRVPESFSVRQICDETHRVVAAGPSLPTELSSHATLLTMWVNHPQLQSFHQAFLEADRSVRRRVETPSMIELNLSFAGRHFSTLKQPCPSNARWEDWILKLQDPHDELISSGLRLVCIRRFPRMEGICPNSVVTEGSYQVELEYEESSDEESPEEAENAQAIRAVLERRLVNTPPIQAFVGQSHRLT
ncbi:hypothetical protein EBZ37_13195 [bacterium]|nr:hypothetical protein [bacterium]